MDFIAVNGSVIHPATSCSSAILLEILLSQKPEICPISKFGTKSVIRFIDDPDHGRHSHLSCAFAPLQKLNSQCRIVHPLHYEIGVEASKTNWHIDNVCTSIIILILHALSLRFPLVDLIERLHQELEEGYFLLVLDLDLDDVEELPNLDVCVGQLQVGLLLVVILWLIVW